jgi:hypothetical protein
VLTYIWNKAVIVWNVHATALGKPSTILDDGENYQREPAFIAFTAADVLVLTARVSVDVVWPRVSTNVVSSQEFPHKTSPERCLDLRFY